MVALQVLGKQEVMSMAYKEMVGGLAFVYGSLRKGLGNHRVIQGSEQQEDGVISGKFRMRSLGGFPAIFKVPEVEQTDIVVEVYEVSTDNTAMGLDMLEGYPSFYNREVVTLDDGRQGWVYFIEGESSYADRPLVIEGDWKKYYRSSGR